ncbi:hypothetical protein PR202_ga09348 [Eleusine coracana subsp. coracana]|uniref:Uncharacterized protein n=1 Tax=Eleusine coracana subsp. coracana TaxID=191504 RepID=A0AAV5C564_ELECO|nr:hypothetical protein PR202_ga09348 [Eleusine coracana subsp. coracana]
MRDGKAISTPPPWAALPLVAPFLDAASLASASCRGGPASRAPPSPPTTSGRALLRARRHYPPARPPLRHLPEPEPSPDPDPDGSDRRHCSSFSSSPHRRLFALFWSASARARALPAPRLALADVAFAVDVFTADGHENTLSFAVNADEAALRRRVIVRTVPVRGRPARPGRGDRAGGVACAVDGGAQRR